MGGAITHIGIGIIGLILIKLIFKNWWYGISFLAGSVLPDFLNWGLITLYMGYFDFHEHMKHPWFGFLTWLGHTWYNWYIFSGIIISFSGILYWFKFISLFRLKYIGICLIYFMFAIHIHLLIDIFVDEKYWWL